MYFGDAEARPEIPATLRQVLGTSKSATGPGSDKFKRFLWETSRKGLLRKAAPCLFSKLWLFSLRGDNVNACSQQSAEDPS